MHTELSSLAVLVLGGGIRWTADFPTFVLNLPRLTRLPMIITMTGKNYPVNHATASKLTYLELTTGGKLSG
jgi:hypothetical protein